MEKVKQQQTVLTFQPIQLLISFLYSDFQCPQNNTITQFFFFNSAIPQLPPFPGLRYCHTLPLCLGHHHYTPFSQFSFRSESGTTGAGPVAP